jgi:hypothetical protein
MNANFYRISKQLNITPKQTEQFVAQVNEHLLDGATYTDILQALRQLPQPYWYPASVAAKIAKIRRCTRLRKTKTIHLPSVWIVAPEEPESSMTTEVVGITYDGRLAVVNKLSIGEPVILRREPWNAYDRNAIMVLRQTGEQLGYINRFLAASLAAKFDASEQEVPGVVVRLAKGGYIMVVIEFTVPQGGIVSLTY